MNDAILVIDVPERVTPEEAAQLLNAPGGSYFLVQVLPIAGGHRAYLRRYKQTPPTKAEAAKDNAEKVDEETALSILRANRDEPLRKIVSLLEKAGVKRGKDWVSEQLTATCTEDGQEEKAIAFVKRYCDPSWTPRDVVNDMRGMLKINRTVAWARQKLKELETVCADNS